MYEGRPEQGNLQDIYDFGNLLDAMATEGHKITGRTMTDRGRSIEFSEEKFAQAIKMKTALDGNDFIALTFRRMRKQHEFYRKKFIINYEGNTVILPARCKTDGDIKSMKLGVDLKGMGAITHEQAWKAFFHFDYDRQAAWYMDVAQLDKMLYVMPAKKTGRNGEHPVNLISVVRGDEIYQSGLRKYSKLAFLYYHLIYNLRL
jgi:hypothetical protein